MTNQFIIAVSIAGIRRDPDLESGMAREAQATALLAHPAIVRVFDHGMSTAGDPFLVMELVQGETLAAAIKQAKNGFRRVYACAELFNEALEIADDVTVYGGLDCANGWAYVGDKTKTALTAAAAYWRRPGPRGLESGRARSGHSSRRCRQASSRLAWSARSICRRCPASLPG